jgi:YggT family protein
MQAVLFLLNAIFGFFTILFLLRFMMQLARVSFAGQLGDFVMRLSNWAVKPLRRVIPGLMGIDWASLLAALALEMLLVAILVAIIPGPTLDGGALTLILWLTARGLLRLTIYILIGALILQAVLSWVNPHAPLVVPAWQLTRPLLAPIRRILPAISGIDLSPLVAILLLQVVLLYL